MGSFGINLKLIVAASIALGVFSSQLQAAAPDMDDLFERLQSADDVDAVRLQREIEMQWAQSGSPAMDLLLRRGKDAIEAGDAQAAIEHFSALIDHAPAFAEGWNGRAQAFFSIGRYGLAIGDLEQVLAINPKHFAAIYGLGTIFEQLDRPEEAYDAYGLVLELHPNHEKAATGIKRLARRVNGVEL